MYYISCLNQQSEPSWFCMASPSGTVLSSWFWNTFDSCRAWQIFYIHRNKLIWQVKNFFICQSLDFSVDWNFLDFLESKRQSAIEKKMQRYLIHCGKNPLYLEIYWFILEIYLFKIHDESCLLLYACCNAILFSGSTFMLP